MPEPVITIIAGVSAIVTNVWRTSKDLYELIDGINNAPRHIQATSRDVRGFYAVLGALQGVLDDLDREQLPQDLILILESLHPNMDNCFEALVEMNLKINRYTKPSGEANRTKWAGILWQFTEKDTREFRGHLAAYKGTVNVALNAASFANSTRSRSTNERLEEEVRQLRRNLNELTGHRDNEGSVAGENGSCLSQATDKDYAMNRFFRFLETAESVVSRSPPDSPNMSATWRRAPSPIPSISPSLDGVAHYDPNHHEYSEGDDNEVESQEFISNGDKVVNSDIPDIYIAPLRLRKESDVAGSHTMGPPPIQIHREANMDKGATMRAGREPPGGTGSNDRRVDRPRTSRWTEVSPNQIRNEALASPSSTRHPRIGGRRTPVAIEEPENQLQDRSEEVSSSKPQNTQNNALGSISNNDQLQKETSSEPQAQVNAWGEMTRPSNPQAQVYESRGRKGPSDIAELMDWLTLRDAQLSARNTEHLVTLVREAAKLRNDLERMKSSVGVKDLRVPSPGLKLAPEASDRHRRSAGVQEDMGSNSRRRANVLSKLDQTLEEAVVEEREAIRRHVHQLPKSVNDAMGSGDNRLPTKAFNNEGREDKRPWFGTGRRWEKSRSAPSDDTSIDINDNGATSKDTEKRDLSPQEESASSPLRPPQVSKVTTENEWGATTTTYRILKPSDSNKSIRIRPFNAAGDPEVAKNEKDLERAGRIYFVDEQLDRTRSSKASSADQSESGTPQQAKLSSQDEVDATSLQTERTDFSRRKKKKRGLERTKPSYDLDDINEVIDEDSISFWDMKRPTEEADIKKTPPLPAPTESDIGSRAGTDLNNNKKATEKPSWKLPEDGGPVQISKRMIKSRRTTTETGSNASQTSLLIEYFEGGKANTPRPSVRVKVTPSAKRKGGSNVKITGSRPRPPSDLNLLTLGDKVKEMPKFGKMNIDDKSVDIDKVVAGLRPATKKAVPATMQVLWQKLQEFANGEETYIRELNTLVDVVIRDLLRMALADSDSSPSNNPLVVDIFKIGIAVEQIRHIHQSFPSCGNDANRFIEWASIVGEAYEEYLNSWRRLFGQGYSDLCVNYFKRSVSGIDLRLEEMMPHDPHGYVISGTVCLAVSVDYLLSIPSIRLAELGKVVDEFDRLQPSDPSDRTAEQFKGLLNINSIRRGQEEFSPYKISLSDSVSHFLEPWSKRLECYSKSSRRSRSALNASKAEACESEISVIPAYSFLDWNEKEESSASGSKKASLRGPSFEGLRCDLQRNSSSKKKPAVLGSEPSLVDHYNFLDGLTKEGKSLRDIFLANYD